jgi:hypothetical protein
MNPEDRSILAALHTESGHPLERQFDTHAIAGDSG